MTLGNDDRLSDGAAIDEANSQRGISRRTIMKGAAWTVPALMVTTAAPFAAASPLTCALGSRTTIGRGKFLTGGLFNKVNSGPPDNRPLNFDTGQGLSVSLNGVFARAKTTAGTLPTTTTGYTANSAPPADPDVISNTFDITALSGINVLATNLTTTVTDILSFVTPAGLGTLNQYAKAGSQGVSIGASGAVDNNGAIATQPQGGYPQLGTVDLKKLLTPLLTGAGATALSNLANLTLELGALAGRAQYDVCQNPAVLSRDYLMAYLRLHLTSPAIANLAGIVRTAVLNIQLPLGIAGLGVNLGVLTNGPIPSGANDPIQVNLANGDATIDVGTLLSNNADPFGAAYSNGLNGLPANSVLFVNNNGASYTTAALSAFAADLITDLQDRLLDAVTVTILGTTATLNQLLNSAIPGVPALANQLKNLIFALFTGTGTVPTALAAVSTVLSTVFGWLQNVLNITLNNQNSPVQPYNGNGVGPARWAAGGADAFNGTGRYDVAALSINAINNAALSLFLGRGSVGPNS